MKFLFVFLATIAIAAALSVNIVVVDFSGNTFYLTPTIQDGQSIGKISTTPFAFQYSPTSKIVSYTDSQQITRYGSFQEAPSQSLLGPLTFDIGGGAALTLNQNKIDGDFWQCSSRKLVGIALVARIGSSISSNSCSQISMFLQPASVTTSSTTTSASPPTGVCRQKAVAFPS